MDVLSGQMNAVQYLQSIQATKSKEHTMERKGDFYAFKIKVRNGLQQAVNMSI